MPGIFTQKIAYYHSKGASKRRVYIDDSHRGRDGKGRFHGSRFGRSPRYHPRVPVVSKYCVFLYEKPIRRPFSKKDHQRKEINNLREEMRKLRRALTYKPDRFTRYYMRRLKNYYRSAERCLGLVNSSFGTTTWQYLRVRHLLRSYRSFLIGVLVTMDLFASYDFHSPRSLKYFDRVFRIQDNELHNLYVQFSRIKRAS